MNNFKKLLASAMALTMVTSVVPVTGVNAAYGLTSFVGEDGNVNSNIEAYNLVKAVTDALTNAGLTKETITIENSEITLGGGKEDLLSNTSGVFSLNESLRSQLVLVQNYAYATDETYTIAKYLLDLPSSLNAMVGVVDGGFANDLYERTNKFLGTTANYENDILKPTAYANATGLMEEFEKYAAFESNLPTTHADGQYWSGEEYLDAKDDLQYAIDQYVAEYYGDELDGYLTALEDLYNAFVENEGSVAGDTGGISKVEVDSILKQIENGMDPNTAWDDVEVSEITKANYRAFGENDSVVAVLGQFEALYDEIEAADEAISNRNDYYVEYTRKQFSNRSVKDIVTGNKYWDVYSELTDEQWAILKEYKEEVVDVVYTVDAKEVGNVFVDRSGKIPFISNTEETSVLGNITPIDLNSIFDFYDKETGTRYWDLLEAHMEGLDEALKAVTDDIAGLTPATIKGSDRELLEAAEDAIYELTTNLEVLGATGGYAGNLTSAQQRTVRQADTKITNLREAFDNLGIVDVNDKDWWQYENGQWVFYQDGHTVSNVWVADINNNWYYAGANGVMLTNSWIARDSSLQVWYYVGADGMMVTNTVVDGCTIDANGVWRA